MKELTRSQWIEKEIQTLLNGNVEKITLLLYPKEMRKLKDKIPTLSYSSKKTNTKRKSDTRVSYEITQIKK